MLISHYIVYVFLFQGFVLVSQNHDLVDFVLDPFQRSLVVIFNTFFVSSEEITRMVFVLSKMSDN